MIEHKGIFYYSCTEIAKMINEPDEDFKPVADKFRQVYDKPNNYIYDSYVQEKLYKAAEKKYIRHIKYQKRSNHYTYRAYAIDDLMSFLNRPDAKNVGFDKKSVRNLIVVEAE